jgi:hypothetical protein
LRFNSDISSAPAEQVSGIVTRSKCRRPVQQCCGTSRKKAPEIQVAELLAALPDDWTVRWGFFYNDNAGTRREGDFLVLGPDGGLLVLEVKGGSLEMFPGTGRWNTDDADNPLYQLDAEWKAVVH